MQVVLDNLPTVYLFVAGVCAPAGGWFAATRGRSPAAWFAFGALLGPLALALLALAPPGRCEACDAQVSGWPSACARCGADLRGGPDIAMPAPALRAALVDGSGDPRVAEPRAPAAPAAPSVSRPLGGGIIAQIHPVGASGVEPTAEQVLSIGVYLSGNAGLEIGATYAIARVGSRLRIFGPVDAGQITVRHEGEIAQFDVTAVDDRVIVSGRGGRSSLAIIFRAIGGMRPDELERTFRAAALDGERGVS